MYLQGEQKPHCRSHSPRSAAPLTLDCGNRTYLPKVVQPQTTRAAEIKVPTEMGVDVNLHYGKGQLVGFALGYVSMPA